ncbi:MAG: hypothetical protein MRJ68_04440 [Nitrospira sp.]|nr:hypothetical protein [Nitrospira sp.]
MSEQPHGLFHFLCEGCRRQSPMLVKGQYRWRCPHHHVTVFEGAGRRSLVFDEDSIRSAKRPQSIDNAHGPFFTRVVTG